MKEKAIAACDRAPRDTHAAKGRFYRMVKASCPSCP
jgi:hypothetical protein